MKRRMKTVSLLASVMMSVLMAPVPAAWAADDAREAPAPVCLASSARAASPEAVDEEAALSREPETQAGSTGYCTVDCSPCMLKGTECQKRGAGSCTQVRACRQAPEP